MNTNVLCAAVIAACLLPQHVLADPATAAPPAAQPENAAPVAAETSGADPAPTVADPQRPRVYKWTDAQGKTYYGDIRPNQAPDAAPVPHVHAGSQTRASHEHSTLSGGSPGATTDPGVTETLPDEANRQALVQRLNALVDELTQQVRAERYKKDLETPATGSDSGSTTDIPTTPKPKVYKWTDARGKTHYSTGTTGNAPNPTVVPITPSSIPNNAEDMTGRFNAMASELAEQRLAPQRAQQELFNADLKRMQQTETAEAEARAAAAQAEILRLQKEIEAKQYAEQEHRREQDRQNPAQKRHSHNQPPPPQGQPTPLSEPPRPVWKPREIPPFQPKEAGVSSR